MADETILANKLMEDVVVGGDRDCINDYVDIFTVDGTDMIASYGVTTEGATAPDIDLVGANEVFTGIIYDYANQGDKKANYSLGVTIGNNKNVKVLRRTGGKLQVQVLIAQTTSTAIQGYKGMPVYVSQTDAGMFSIAHPGDTTADKQFVGYLAEDTGAFTANRVSVIWY